MSLPFLPFASTLQAGSVTSTDDRFMSSSLMASPDSSSFSPSISPLSTAGVGSRSHESPAIAPGPEFFRHRREQWLTPRSPSIPRPPSPSTSRAKLESMLAQPGAVESDDVWKEGLRSIWKGLMTGGRLRRRLSLAIVTQILRAGWLRDGTWPEGMAPPADSDSPSEAPASQPIYQSGPPGEVETTRT